MQDLALRIITAAAVALVLFLYLYDSGARRFCDIVIALAVFVVTLPVFAVLASASSLRNVRIFDRTEKGLTFTYPNNALKRLPFFLSVICGMRHILPIKLFGRKRNDRIETAETK